MTVNISAKVNGTVTVNVNGINYTVNVVNGEGKLPLSGLANTTYNIQAVFAGNEKYLANTSNIIVVKVNKAPTRVNVTAEAVIAVGSDALINITLNETINATVVLRVNGTEYNVAIVNGVGNFTIAHLAKGVYYINATYAGDDKYIESTSQTIELNVTQITTELTVNTTKVIVVGSDAVINITLNRTINTTVVLRVNGTEYNVAVVNGVGNFTIAHLAKGVYYINATYAGDDKYVGSESNTVVLNVTKVPTALTVNTTGVIVVGSDAVINITLNETVNATVVLRVNGTEYNVALM